MALFGMTVILGPVMGPLIGGWLTENLSWHYAFFVNVPICAVLLLLLFVGLPHEEPKWEYLTDADWAGIAGLIGERLAVGGAEQDVRLVQDSDRVPAGTEGYDGLVILGGPLHDLDARPYPNLGEEARPARGLDRQR